MIRPLLEVAEVAMASWEAEPAVVRLLIDNWLDSVEVFIITETVLAP